MASHLHHPRGFVKWTAEHDALRESLKLLADKEEKFAELLAEDLRRFHPDVLDGRETLPATGVKTAIERFSVTTGEGEPAEPPDELIVDLADSLMKVFARVLGRRRLEVADGARLEQRPPPRRRDAARGTPRAGVAEPPPSGRRPEHQRGRSGRDSEPGERAAIDRDRHLVRRLRIRHRHCKATLAIGRRVVGPRLGRDAHTHPGCGSTVRAQDGPCNRRSVGAENHVEEALLILAQIEREGPFGRVAHEARRHRDPGRR